MRNPWLLLVVGGLWAVSASRAQSPRPLSKLPVEELVQHLGSSSFKEREEAARLLTKRRDALPLLEKARHSANAEIARRAARILEAVAKAQAKAMVRRLKALGLSGRIDAVAELLCRWPKDREESACWDATCQIALSLLEQHTKQGGQKIRGVFNSATPRRPIAVLASKRVEEVPPEPIDAYYFIRATEVEFYEPPICGIIGCSGPVHIVHLGSSVVFATGPVWAKSVVNSLIISDGDVRVGNVNNTLIVARGTVTYSGLLRDCRIVAGRAVKKESKRARLHNCKVSEHEANPLGFIKFFDPAREGITVAPAKEGVSVKAVGGGKPFAKAGLRPGDVITAVNSQSSDSPEEFRRLLRRGLFAEDGVTLRIRRGDKALQVRVPPPR
jgi:hypothetical protein